MGKRIAAAVGGVLLMATCARASDLTGTYTAEEDGERVTLELRVEGDGAVKGSLRTGGATLSLEGRAAGATFEAVCTMPGIPGPAMRLRGRLEGGAQLHVTTTDGQGQPLDDEPLVFQRQGGARPGAGTPAVPDGGNPLGGGGPPAGGRQAPYAGTFQGDGLTLELQATGAAYEGTLTFQGQRMACKASPVPGGLRGTFSTGQGEFAFEAQDAPAGLRLTSGGQAYSLARQGPPPGPVNPLGGGPATAGADAAGLPVEATHPAGVQFRMPEGWQALAGAQGVRLLPPGCRADDPNVDELHVLLAEVVQPQVTGPEHPDVATFLDGTMAQTFPLLRRQGGCQPLETPAGKAGVYTWTGAAPTGAAVEGKAWVFVLQGKGAAFISVATAARLREREPALRRIVGSARSVKVEADPRVVGGYFCNGGWRSRDAKVSSDSHSTLTLAQDGRFQETWLSYVSTPAGIVENKEEKAGTYTAAGGVLTLRYQSGSVSAFRYALAQDGSLQCTSDDGGQTVWRRR